MAAFTCRKCGKLRARASGELCPVCWLVRELKREHKRGEHIRFNVSCIRCTRAVALPRVRVVRSLGTTSNKEITMKLPTSCVDCGGSLRKLGRASSAPHRAMGFEDMCGPCYLQAGLHNAHVDGHHEKDLDARCKLCVDSPSDDVVKSTRQATTKEPAMPNTTRTSNMSHASCTHPRTPAGRAACRKAIKNTNKSETMFNIANGKGKVHLRTGGCPASTKLADKPAALPTNDALTCGTCIKISTKLASDTIDAANV